MIEQYKNNFVSFEIPADFSIANDETIFFDLQTPSRAPLPHMRILFTRQESYSLPTTTDIQKIDAHFIPDKEVTFLTCERMTKSSLRGYKSQMNIHSEKLAAVWGGDMHYGIFEYYKTGSDFLIKIITKTRASDNFKMDSIADDLFQSITYNERSLEFYKWFTDERRISDTWI